MEKSEIRSMSERTLSAYPLSVGTSLALETLFQGPDQSIDPDREVPEFRGINRYDEFWVNIATLFRNMVHAVPSMVFLKAGTQELHDLLNHEMDTIEGIFQSNTNGLCKVIFYHASYKKIKHEFKKNEVKFREPSTPFQLHYAGQFEQIVSTILKNRPGVRSIDSDIRPDTRSRALILTSSPYDLVHRQRFTLLELIESHTGKVKPHFEWYSKYYPVPNSDMSILPFHEGLLLIFGDSFLIQPHLMQLRRAVIDVAFKGKWSPVTSLDKVRFDCQRLILEPFVAQFVNKLL